MKITGKYPIGIVMGLALSTVGSLPVSAETINQQFNVIYSADFNHEKPSKPSVLKLPRDAYKDIALKSYKPKPEQERPPSRLHPVLEKWLEKRNPHDEELLLVSFKDNLTIPNFPIPNEDLPRDADENREALKKADALIREIKSARAEKQKQFVELLHGRYGVEVVDSFWLVNSFLVKSPLGKVKELLENKEILYIEPDTAGEVPPAGEIVDGRKEIVSDPYFNLGQTSGYIGLLDTGIRFSHSVFNSPSNLDFRYDCTDGVCDNVPDITDDCWNHGTKTASVVTGNGNLGNDFRGATAITLDSMKVYPGGCGFLSGTAVLKAFEKAIAILDRVIIAEMQGGGNFNSAISLAADAAFDAGAVVIAANGNNGPNAGTVNAPANAHKALGIGNFHVTTKAQINSQSRGPTADNRLKPDVQAPTNTITASSASDFATGGFGGTSGATPYGASAAALLRNWMRGGAFNIDPGQVYSHMILSGQQPFPFNNTSGAGKIKMPTGGTSYWGKVSMGHHQTIEIPINVPAGKNKIEGSLWWPEGASQTHNDIDIFIVSPSGTIMDTSVAASSVFERVRYTSSNLQTGTWKIRIYGYSVPAPNQTVYWGARTR